MKKLFTLFFAACSVAATAQITINQADMAVIGKTVILAYDNGTPGLTPGATGANQTWNFSSVTSTDQDTLVFSNTAGTPHASHFPAANVYIPNLGIYLVKNSSGVFIDGGSDPQMMGMMIDFNPNEQIISFPNTYQSTFSNTSAYAYSDSTSQIPLPGVDSIRIKHSKVKNAVTDAWGNITTPAGTFGSIRVKSVEVSKDSIFLHIPIVGWSYFQDNQDTNTHYAWFAQGRFFPVFEMDVATDGSVNGMDYLKIDPVSVNDEKQLAAKVYPNPATDYIHFNTAANSDVTLRVFDVKGAEVRFTGSSTGKIDLPVSGMVNGTYFYIISDEKGNASKGEFNVLH